MTDRFALVWDMASKNESQARDEWSVMVSRCVHRLGRPPMVVTAGRVATALLAPHMPDGVKLVPAVNLPPTEAHMDVGE